MFSRVTPRMAGVLALLLAAPSAFAATGDGIRFNGATQYVTFGTASSLGKPTFTLELWFKREGAGRATSTGTGGLTAIPLLAKGRGEVDGDNRDMAYFLGIRKSDGVLVADFEEGTAQSSPGLNHPIAGTTPIETNVWYHAAATFDGRNWRLYLNGVLEREIVLTTGHLPQSGSIQHASLASALNSTGGADGYFQGILDEARIWGHARPGQGIKDSLTLQITSAPGLLGRWALDLISSGMTANSVPGGSHGAVVGGAATTTGSPFAIVAPRPPTAPQLVGPANGSTQVSLSPTLSVSAFDPDGGPLSVSFHGRPVAVNSTAADFTLIGIPDTQYYVSSLNGGTPTIFNSQTAWIASNRASRNIAAAVHLGDCVQNGDGVITEWQYVDNSMRKIESASGTGLTYGIPYGVCVGNHDQSPSGNADGTTTLFNQYFGSTRFQGRPYYGGHYGSNNDNSFALFTAGGMKFIIVFMEYDTSPDAAVLSWANNLLATYSDRRAIVASHYIINAGNPASFGTQGQAIYNALKGNANLFLMLCGHVQPSEGRRSDTYNGRTVHSVLSDYQDRSNGGDGWLRIYEFSPSKNVIRVRTYSPTLGRFEADADSSSQFTLPYDMTIGTTFQSIATSNGVASGATASATWNGLSPNTTYEWYAVVSDGVRSAAGPTWQFTTGSGGNLIANGGFESNLSGWSSYGSSVLSQAGEGHSGSRSLRMQGPSSTGFFGTDDEPNAVGTVAGVGAVYRFSAWVKSTTGSTGKAKLRIYEFLGSTQQGSTFYSPAKTLSSGWQLLTVDYTVRTAGTKLSLRVSDEPVANGESFLVDDVSITLVSGPAMASELEFGTPVADGPVLSASVWPNPIHREGVLGLALTRPGFARGELFDATGRCVGSLLNEPNLAAGDHRIPIAVRGPNGPLPTGVYFYRIETGEGMLHGRMVVID